MSRYVKNPIPNNKGNEEPETMTHSTLSGLLWMFSGSLLQAVLQGIVLIFLARLVTPADFGLVGAALVVVGFSAFFSQLGIGQAMVQRANLEERHIRTGFTISLIFGILLAGAVSFIAPVISSLFRMEKLTLVLRAMSFLFLLQGVSVVAQSLLQRELRFRCLAKIQVVSYALGYGVIGVGLAFMEFGVWALVVAYLTQGALRSIILLIVKPHPKFPHIERHALRDMIYFGGGFTATRIANYIALQSDNLVVARWLGPGALGLYGRAYQLMVLPANLLGQVLDRVLFPAMAKVQNEPERLAKAYRRGVALIALVVLPMSGGIIGLAPEIIRVLLGPGWTEAIVPFQILTVGMLFRTSYKMSHSLARATGAVYPSAWRQAIYAALVLGGAWIGKHWGISGVALGVLGAIGVNFILMAQLSLKLTSITWRTLLAAHLPGLFLAAVVYAQVVVVVMVVRDLAMPAVATLIISLVTALITLLILLRFRPRFVLGNDGMWMLNTLGVYLSEKFDHFDWARNAWKRVYLA